MAHQRNGKKRQRGSIGAMKRSMFVGPGDVKEKSNDYSFFSMRN